MQEKAQKKSPGSDFLFQRYFDGGGEATGVGSYPETEGGGIR